MMLRSTATKWLWDNRRSVIGWTVAITAVGVFYGAMWPAFNDPEILETFESYPSGLMEALNYTNIGTPTGYLDATVYGLIAANLAVVYAVMTGTRLIAGDEHAGTLDLVLALPRSRTNTALQRFAAFVLATVAISLGLLLGMTLLTAAGDYEGVSIAGLAAMHLHFVCFAAFFGALAFSIGAATGRTALTVGCCVGVAVVGFAANGLLPQIEGLEWTRNWSPYHWLNGEVPLESGVQLDSVLLMVLLVVGFVALGIAGFRRRDVNV
jgi:ABC-2 type transport system permease protein